MRTLHLRKGERRREEGGKEGGRLRSDCKVNKLINEENMTRKLDTIRQNSATVTFM